MVQEFQIHSFDQFKEAVAKFPDKVFRGQTTDYPNITPSVFRQKIPLDIAPLMRVMKNLYFDAHRVDELAAIVRENEGSGAMWVDDDDDDDNLSWFGRVVSRIFNIDVQPASRVLDDDDDDDGTWNPYRPQKMVGHGMGSASDYDEYNGLQWSYSLSGHYHHGLLQHYGAPTPAIDVAYDANIALWFASNKLVLDNSTRIAWYEPSTQIGIVYVMSASANQLVDLRRGDILPIAGLRGQRQCGALLVVATQAAPNLNSHVISKFHIHPGTFDSAAPQLQKLTQSYLFPPPAEDKFYQLLLEAKTAADPDIRLVASYIVDYLYK
jgi:hypothetical protein